MFIFLKKRVRAGILLYALLMLAVFSLFLQFYLHRQVAESRLVGASKQQATAYIMAQMTLDDLRGQLSKKEPAEKETSILQSEVESSRTVASAALPSDFQSQTDAATTSVADQGSTASSPPASAEEPSDNLAQTIQAGQVSFSTGQVTYQQDKGQLVLRVTLKSQETYSYRFPIPSQN